VEAYLVLLTGVLVIGIGLWMLWQVQAHTHSHTTEPVLHQHTAPVALHRHGWGLPHTHSVAGLAQQRPQLLVRLGLGLAGGLLPDPAALVILLSALVRSKLMLGLSMALVFSLGFASTLVVVGAVAARVGQAVLVWLSGPWVVRRQKGTALLPPPATFLSRALLISLLAFKRVGL
jgi:nickel/cobalt exporter